MPARQDNGFTLIEVMLVVILLAVLAAIAVPKLAVSSDAAREKADIATGRQIKAALDRYQIENGVYPKLSELKAADGEISGSCFVPDYIKKLDQNVTQQIVDEDKRGFDVVQFSANSTAAATRLVMIYLTADGSDAEVKVFNKSLSSELWSSD